MISRFTQSVLGAGGFDFVAAHFQCERDRFSPQNPDGYVNLGSAQNYLHADALQTLVAGVETADEDCHYQPFWGTESCRVAIAAYLSRRVEVNRDDIVVGNGIISVLEALAVALLDPNDEVIVPTPVFPGLVKAISFRTGGKARFLHTRAEDGFRLTPAHVRTALQQDRRNGVRTKAILLCSPGNPVGQVFSREELLSFHDIAVEFDVALIVDEVYAESCFDGVSFESAIDLASDRVFVLGGLSKDFALAGYATGWLHGTNQDIMRAVRAQSHFFRLSAPVQRAIEAALHPAWIENYVPMHRQKLTSAFALCREELAGVDVAVVPTDAGLCCYLDLRDHLETLDQAGELRLYQRLLNEHRVHLSPGVGFHHPTAGFFRICFSQDDRTLREGLLRICNGLSSVSFHPSHAITESSTP